MAVCKSKKIKILNYFIFFYIFLRILHVHVLLWHIMFTNIYFLFYYLVIDLVANHNFARLYCRSFQSTFSLFFSFFLIINVR